MSLASQVKAIPGMRAVVRPAWRWFRQASRHGRDRLQDWWLGIDTTAPGGRLAPAFADDTGYEPLSYAAIRRLHRFLQVTADDTLFDVGCGKGRILCCFARWPIGKCVGIERVADYVVAARNNAARVAGRRAPIEVRQQEAAEADYSEATIILLFNPFGLDTMRRVADRIRLSWESRPRRLRIAYVNALSEEVWEEADWLRTTHTFVLPFRGKWKMKAVIWEAGSILSEVSRKAG